MLLSGAWLWGQNVFPQWLEGSLVRAMGKTTLGQEQVGIWDEGLRWTVKGGLCCFTPHASGLCTFVNCVLPLKGKESKNIYCTKFK